ncbi:hypothetical protein D3C85_765150 [compost metagenome]
MYPKEITIDEDLHGLLIQGARDRFTIRELSDAYAEFLQDDSLNGGNLKMYVFNQVLRLVEVDWVKRVRVNRGGDQAFKLMSKPLDLEVTFTSREKHVKRRSNGSRKEVNVAASQERLSDGFARSRADAKKYLGGLHEEIRSDLLSSMGEVERYQQLIDVLPHLRGKIEGAYLDARDRRARLQGHMRAVQTTLSALK